MTSATSKPTYPRGIDTARVPWICLGFSLALMAMGVVEARAELLGPTDLWLMEIALSRAALTTHPEALLLHGLRHVTSYHLGLNLLGLWAFGLPVEQAMGSWKAAALGISSIALGGVAFVLLFADAAGMGFSGAVAAFVGCFAVLRWQGRAASRWWKDLLGLLFGVALLSTRLSFVPHVMSLVIGMGFGRFARPEQMRAVPRPGVAAVAFDWVSKRAPSTQVIVYGCVGLFALMLLPAELRESRRTSRSCLRHRELAARACDALAVRLRALPPEDFNAASTAREPSHVPTEMASGDPFNNPTFRRKSEQAFWAIMVKGAARQLRDDGPVSSNLLLPGVSPENEKPADQRLMIPHALNELQDPRSAELLRLIEVHVGRAQQACDPLAVLGSI